VKESMAIEAELQFRVPTCKLTTLANSRIPGGKVTGKQKLKRHGLSLRVRRNGKQHIQTVKSESSAQFGLDEWETEIKDGRA
jgi:hypothetical protein